MKFLKIKSINKINLNSKLYDIQTKNRNFFCNNILVHNSLFRIVVKSSNLYDLNGDDSDFLCFTRFSFANRPISDLVKETWSEMALKCLSDGQKAFMRMHSKYTYVFEFCSPYTQVVTFFPEPKMVMTGLFDNQTGEEVSSNNEVYKQCKILFSWVKEYNFKSIDEILKHLDKMFEDGSSDEGFVIKDKNGVRLKLKNKKYLLLHRFSNNGNVQNLKLLIPIVMQGETSEIESYFPNLIPYLESIQSMIKTDLEYLKEIYSKVIIQESQKDFALVLTKDFNTPFFGIFFQLRKKFGNRFTFAQVKEEFMKAEELVIKVYKSRGIIGLDVDK